MRAFNQTQPSLEGNFGKLIFLITLTASVNINPFHKNSNHITGKELYSGWDFLFGEIWRHY